MRNPLTIYTIGHSSQAIDAFIDLLRQHRIEVVADVRTAPYSRFVPHFSKKPLQTALETAGIRYLYMGGQLGGMPDDDRFYDDYGYVLYGKLSQSEPFQHGIRRLLDGIEKQRVTLMCAEEDPARCHRTWLITPVLLRHNVSVMHIRGDGRLEPAATTDPANPGFGSQSDLFASDSLNDWKSPKPSRRKK